MTNVADEIKKLKELLDDGVINQEEFDEQKKALLNNRPEPNLNPAMNQASSAQPNYQQPQYQPAYPQYQQPNIIINNSNANTNMNHMAGYGGRMKNKWVAFFLCLFVGFIGIHKFYEGKIGMGILYFFTGGLFIIGVVIDLITLLTKPNPYYV